MGAIEAELVEQLDDDLPLAVAGVGRLGGRALADAEAAQVDR